MLFQVGLNPLLLCLQSRGSTVYFIKQHKKDNYRKSQLQLNRRTALWDRLTFLRLISSFFCSTNLAGIPPMLSWALQRCSHNSPRKMRAFLGLRKPVRLICISFGSGNCKDRGRQHMNVGHTDRQGISTYQHLPCPAESSHNKKYTLWKWFRKGRIFSLIIMLAWFVPMLNHEIRHQCRVNNGQ